MSEKDKYYFLTVEEVNHYRSLREIHNWIVMGQHPIIWLAKKRKEWPGYRFTILFWSEIPESIAMDHGRIQWAETGKFCGHSR